MNVDLEVTVERNNTRHLVESAVDLPLEEAVMRIKAAAQNAEAVSLRVMVFTGPSKGVM